MIIEAKAIYESFLDPQGIIEGFEGSLDDLQLISCPAKSNQYIDAKGNVLCCEGTVVSSSCSGTTICTLSEASDNYPTCGLWLASHLNEKGAKRCPTNMPNYFESEDEQTKGCTGGKRNKTGSGPADNTSKTCKLYVNQIDDERNIDSCTNQKLLESTRCFSTEYPNTTKVLEINKAHPKSPAWVRCSYSANGENASCNSDESYNRLISREIEYGTMDKNYKQNASDWQKMDFCSITEKVKITKTLAFADLKGVSCP